jgi:translation initiation factor 3 subunit M
MRFIVVVGMMVKWKLGSRIYVASLLTKTKIQIQRSYRDFAVKGFLSLFWRGTTDRSFTHLLPTFKMTTLFPPHPSSILVNVSDDADLRLVRVLAPSTSNPNTFEKDCATAVSNGDAASLLRTVINSGAVAGLLTSDYTLDEAVCAFSLLTVYLDRVNDAVVESELCNVLADAVTAVGVDEGTTVGGGGIIMEKRSAMIAALFNLRSSGTERVRLLARIVDMADTNTLIPGDLRGVSALADALDPTTLKSSIAMWSGGADVIDDSILRSLYASVSRGMDRVLASLTKTGGEGKDKTIEAKIKATRERKQTYMLLFLDTYKDESHLDGDATTYARDAAVYAIRDPIHLFATQRHILSLIAISTLQKSQPALYDLLKIIMEGKLQDYRDFTAMPDKLAVFSTFDINEGRCMENMCLLSLVSLASEHEEIPYGAIATTLNVSEDEVERWVIRAVSSGLIDAKMDQLRRVVIVERCAVRQFGIKEWTAMKVRLDKWKSNVKEVLDALQKSGATATAVDGQ